MQYGVAQSSAANLQDAATSNLSCVHPSDKPVALSDIASVPNTGNGGAHAGAQVPGDVSSYASGEQNRRARRARRAALIFREQKQSLLAEDAASEGRPQPAFESATARMNTPSAGSIVSSNSRCEERLALPLFSLTTSLAENDIVSVSSTDTVCNNTGKCVGGQNAKVLNHIHSGPTRAQNATAAFHATFTNSHPGLTSDKITSLETHLSINVNNRPPQPPALSVAEPQIGDKENALSSVSVASASVTVTMASTKVCSSISGSDAGDGNDSDEDGNFVITRTAGKRRLNGSAADMVANEILDDVNEDLIMVDEETTDPIKRLHRGYMNEAVAMVRMHVYFLWPLCLHVVPV